MVPKGKFTVSLFFVHSAMFILLFSFSGGGVLGLCCYAQAFSNCGEQGLLFAVELRLLIMVASLFVEHGLEHTGFSSCGMWTQQLWCTGLVAPWHVAS